MRYTVEIPKKLKPSLRKRFSLTSLERHAPSIIRFGKGERCALCEHYGGCKNGCPLDKFVGGCVGWLNKTACLVGYSKKKPLITTHFSFLSRYIWVDTFEEAKELMRWIQKAGKKYIKWV